MDRTSAYTAHTTVPTLYIVFIVYSIKMRVCAIDAANISRYYICHAITAYKILLLTACVIVKSAKALLFFCVWCVRVFASFWMHCIHIYWGYFVSWGSINNSGGFVCWKNDGWKNNLILLLQYIRYAAKAKVYSISVVDKFYHCSWIQLACVFVCVCVQWTC